MDLIDGAFEEKPMSFWKTVWIASCIILFTILCLIPVCNEALKAPEPRSLQGVFVSATESGTGVGHSGVFVVRMLCGGDDWWVESEDVRFMTMRMGDSVLVTTYYRPGRVGHSGMEYYNTTLDKAW